MPNRPVDRLDRFDGSGYDARMTDHVAVRKIDAYALVFAGFNLVD